MKNFILTMLFALMSIFSVAAATNDNPTYYVDGKMQFTQIVVEAPCRVLYGVSDTTAVSIKNANNDVYKVYYEIQDSILYIKTNEYIDNILNDYNSENMPLIRIFNKDIMPKIKTSSSLQICEATSSTKKNVLKNGTTSSTKN